jgi:Domain of unknown function (DUF4190)
MTASGDAGGESEHGGEATPPPTGQQAPEQPWGAPWDAPAYSPPAYTPPTYTPPVDYPTGYGQVHPTGYPDPFPPTGYPPPQQFAPQQFGPQQFAPQPGPPGYGPPSYPGAYPGYPGGYYPDYLGRYGAPGAAQGGMNGLAVASLATSFTGLFCCLGSIVAIVLGAVALDQVKKHRQEGYGLAVAGIALGVAGLVVFLVVFLFAMQSH